MEFVFELKMLTYISIAGLSAILIFHFLSRGRKGPLLYSYVAFQTIILLWAFHDMALETFRIMSPELQAEKTYLVFIYYYLEFFITCFSPYVWLVFCIYYSNLGKGGIINLSSALAIPPAFFFCLFAAGYFNGYMSTWRNMPEFYIYMLVCYLYIFAGMIVIALYTIRQSGLFKKQAAAVSVCAVLPLACSLIQNYRLHILRVPYEVFGVDLTLVSFSVTMLMIFIAAFKYRFLNPLPYAMTEQFNSMKQPIVVIDGRNVVLSCNEAFQNSFSGFCGIRQEDDASAFFSMLKTGIIRTDDVTRIIEAVISRDGVSFEGEAAFAAPLDKCYSVSIRPILINNSDFVGKVIVLNDITELKSLIGELDRKNAELVAVNGQLTDYADVMVELAAERERNRIAQDIHDTVGQSMTVLNTIINACIISCEKDPKTTKEKLVSAVNVAREGISEMRRAITGLAPGRLDSEGLGYSLNSLVRSFEESGLAVDLIVEDMDTINASEYPSFIYRLCQEAMTNAVRHGRANRVEIFMQAHMGNVRIYISDDGTGCKTVNKGYGLTGIEKKVRDFNGKLSLGTRGEAGFSIYIELPVKKTTAKLSGRIEN